MSLIVDCAALCSLVGIWPRFIEPRRLKVTELSWQLNPNCAHLDGLKIVQLSDLHFHDKVPQNFLKKITSKVNALKPDLLLFTGDFLCYAQLECPERLSSFLCTLEAPLGCFCSFGNHDYAQYVSLNPEGIYDIRSTPNPLKGILRGLKALISSAPTKHSISERAKAIPLNTELGKLLEKTPFQVLENTTVTLPIGLNLSGLGDLALGRCCPKIAFADYQPQFPGIVLSHNPDSFPALLDFPGDWILAGHTHGEQIHLPWPKWGRKLSQKLARLDNREYTRGLFTIGNKKLYVSRGLGSHEPFRLFSPPEICLIKATL